MKSGPLAKCAVPGSPPGPEGAGAGGEDAVAPELPNPGRDSRDHGGPEPKRGRPARPGPAPSRIRPAGPAAPLPTARARRGAPGAAPAPRRRSCLSPCLSHHHLFQRPAPAPAPAPVSPPPPPPPPIRRHTAKIPDS